MSEIKATPGPWVTDDHETYWSILADGPNPQHVADVRQYTPHLERLPEGDANARLIAAAPAMALAIEMLAFGVARLERSGGLIEFCFDGIRYGARRLPWGELIGIIGWDKCREALAKAKAQ